MSDFDNKMEQVEVSIEEAKKAIEKGDALNRLIGNKDFQLIIEDGYFVNEAKDKVSLLALPQFDDEKAQLRLQNSISAISYLRLYFSAIFQKADQSIKAIEEFNQFKNELIEEEQR